MNTSGDPRGYPGGNPQHTTEDPEEIHEFVCDLARRAGALQLSRYENPGKVREKGPKDLVTEVDLLWEELRVTAIRDGYPTTPSSPKSRAVRSRKKGVPGCSTP